MLTKDKTKIKPLGSRVLIQKLDEETQKGKILLPENAKKKQETAIVIAIGEGEKTKEGKILPIPVKVNDKILIDKYSGQEININDEEFVIVKSEDIIAIIEE